MSVWPAAMSIVVYVAATCCCGCRTTSQQSEVSSSSGMPAERSEQAPEIPVDSKGVDGAADPTLDVVQTGGETPERDSIAFAFVDNEAAESASAQDLPALEITPLPESIHFNELAALEAEALRRNPELTRLQRETAAAWAKVRYVDELPDPTIGFNVFAEPIETAAGSQRANMTVMQMIPWLGRLDAQAQQSAFEAMAMQQMYQAERLNIIGDLRANWAKSYLLARTLEIIDANRQLLELLIEPVNARIAQNIGSTGDVTRLVVEIGKLEEQRLMTEQQIESTLAEINRLTNRPAETPIALPVMLDSQLPEWSHAMLRRTAWQRQPAIEAARLRTQASDWGIEVARLRQRPDLSVSASWAIIDNNRPPSMVVDVGQDAWSLGAQVSIPLWEEKYAAMEDEAVARHFAAHATVADLERRYDARLLDLLQQARSASETATLYESSIIPQAEQTLQADQQALANNRVDLDRLIMDVRNVLTLQIAYHRSLAELATAIARIQQAVGTDLAN